ncbi:nuclear apoptosis-inducing factor 1-like [Pecten maximus]|uniref:nuclear apoptosis-inducing factor 1-like n=1 Tax=Pecten maximus TaxID=6579 RepID=UPI001458CAC3|nr:nuclear apoptosis-inducing factor 1-like [Pecten maximus]
MATKRAMNWTEKEKVVLVEEVVRREDILFGKFRGSVVTHETKQAAWDAVTFSVNAIAQIQKSTDQVRKQYSNIKQRAKETVDHMRKTGGGPKTEATASQSLLLENIGSRPEVVGLPVNFDTEDSNYNFQLSEMDQDPEETCVLSVVSDDTSGPSTFSSKMNNQHGIKRKNLAQDFRDVETENIKLENVRVKEETKKILLEQEKLKLEIEVLKLKRNYYSSEASQLCGPTLLYES